MGRNLKDRYVTAAIAIGAVFHLGTGVWAFAAPRSFYEVIATFPPYNVHFLHDVGAFLLGIGAAMAGALVWRDARFVALLGGTVAAAVHWVSHVVDRHHGGNASDPWLLGLFAVVLLLGLVARWPARSGAHTEHDAERSVAR